MSTKRGTDSFKGSPPRFEKVSIDERFERVSKIIRNVITRFTASIWRPAQKCYRNACSRPVVGYHNLCKKEFCSDHIDGVAATLEQLEDMVADQKSKRPHIPNKNHSHICLEMIDPQYEKWTEPPVSRGIYQWSPNSDEIELKEFTGNAARNLQYLNAAKYHGLLRKASEGVQREEKKFRKRFEIIVTLCVLLISAFLILILL